MPADPKSCIFLPPPGHFFYTSEQAHRSETAGNGRWWLHHATIRIQNIVKLGENLKAAVSVCEVEALLLLDAVPHKEATESSFAVSPPKVFGGLLALPGERPRTTEFGTVISGQPQA